MSVQLEIKLQQTRDPGEAQAILFVAKLAELVGVNVHDLALLGCWREIPSGAKLRRAPMNFIQQFRAARRFSTPLVAVRTAGRASINLIVTRGLNGEAATTPLLAWDVLRGLRGLNDPGKATAAKMLGGAKAETASTRPSDVLRMAQLLDNDAVLFAYSMHQFWTDPVVAQGVWNLRDTLKSRGAMLAMLIWSGATAPAGLAQDVLILDEPLPTREEIGQIVDETFAAAKEQEPGLKMDGPTRERAVDALAGLAAYPAEQSFSMSIDPQLANGVDLEQLWQRKCTVIEQTPGLKIHRGKVAEPRGLDNAKAFLRRVMEGRERPNVILFADEVEEGVRRYRHGPLGNEDGAHRHLVHLDGRDGRQRDALHRRPRRRQVDAREVDRRRVRHPDDLHVDRGVRILARRRERDPDAHRAEGHRRHLRGARDGDRNVQLDRSAAAGDPAPLQPRHHVLRPALGRRARASVGALRKAVRRHRGAPRRRGLDGRGDSPMRPHRVEPQHHAPRSGRFIVPVSMSASEQIEDLRANASGRYISASQPGVFRLRTEVVTAPKRKFAKFDRTEGPVTMDRKGGKT